MTLTKLFADWWRRGGVQLPMMSSSLEMRSPDEYEHRYWEDNAAAAAA
jgi:hypothetical protein